MQALQLEEIWKCIDGGHIESFWNSARRGHIRCTPVQAKKGRPIFPGRPLGVLC